MRIGYRVDATAAACLWLEEIPAPANQRITATERLGFMQAMGEYQVSGCRQIANALFRDVSKLLNGVFANYGRMTSYPEVDAATCGTTLCKRVLATCDSYL